MADQYSVNAKFTADTSGFSSGVNKATKEATKFSKSIKDTIDRLGQNGLTKSLANITLATKGITGAFSGFTNAVKKVSASLKECTELYKKQAQAEIQLETAVKNNPLMSSEATDNLKNFASEMQKVSVHGDEELIPMLARLVASGRSEAEAMKIVKAALDIDASGTMDLNSAVNALNATMNGNIGTLGRQFGELKNLSAEELRAGNAVDILASKFKGLAEESAKTIGSAQQLSNAFGDLKENLGASLQASLTPFQNAVTSIITRINDAIAKTKEAEKVAESLEKGGGDLKSAKQNLAEYGGKLVEARVRLAEVNSQIEEQQRLLETANKRQKKNIENNISVLQGQLQFAQEAVDEAQALYDLAEKRYNEALALNEKTSEGSPIEDWGQVMLNNELALNNEIEALRKSAEIRGENLSLQDELNTYIKYTEELMQQTNGAISEGHWYYDERLKIIKQIQKAIKDSTKEEEESLDINKAIHDIKVATAIKLAEMDKERKAQLEAEREQKEQAVDEAQKNYDEAEGLENKVGALKKLIEAQEKAGNSTTALRGKLLLLQAALVAMKGIQFLVNLMNGVAKGFQKAGEIIVKVAGQIKGALTSIANYDWDNMVDNLLKFEDKILTFFYTTLPKLPQMISSMIGSIANMFSQIADSIDSNTVSELILSILNSISDNIDSVVDSAGDIIGNIVTGLIDAVGKWIAGGGWKKLLKAFLNLQKKIEKVVVDNIDDIVDTIDKMLPDLVDTLIDSIVSASETLGKIIGPVLKIIGKLFNAILDVILSDEVINSSIDTVGILIEKIITWIIENLVPILLRIINAIVNKGPEVFPKLVNSVIDGFINGFKNADWKDAMKNMSDTLEGIFKKALSVLTLGLSDLFMDTPNKDGTKKTTEQKVGSTVAAVLTGGLSKLFGFATGVNNAPKGLALVGEKGPELIDFRGGERVYNANATKGIMQSGGTSNQFNVTFNNMQDTSAYAMINQLKAYNRQMAINGIL